LALIKNDPRQIKTLRPDKPITKSPINRFSAGAKTATADMLNSQEKTTTVRSALLMAKRFIALKIFMVYSLIK